MIAKSTRQEFRAASRICGLPGLPVETRQPPEFGKDEAVDLAGASLKDPFGRQLSYLRLSVTDACNFKCAYCLPGGYVKPASVHRASGGSASELEAPLTVKEIKNLVRAFASMGFRKVRLTGGEPTVRRDIVEIARAVSSVSGITKVGLTTNGYRLKELAHPLRQAGISALNVSVDSLDPGKFGIITGQTAIKDRFKDVMDGIEAAIRCDFSSVKINVVLLKGLNDGDFDKFLSLAAEKPVHIRFIELMETGDNKDFFKRHHVPVSLIEENLLAKGWRKKRKSQSDGPALVFFHPDFKGAIGLIAPYSKDFCVSCNRLRVTSRGCLKLCLFGERDYSLRPWLQSEGERQTEPGTEMAELVSKIRELIERKPVSHHLNEGNYGNTWNLVSIGG